jgi:ectoine hydroxylase-related dioxygenase (phytanoyl-CoA dioxygenase family)
MLLRAHRAAARRFSCEAARPAASIAAAQQKLNANGFVVIENVLAPALVARLKTRYSPLFAGKFDSMVFPDEWHWREGISLPNATREIVNAWKSDYTIAGVVLHSQLGRVVSEMMQWEKGAKIAQDDVLYKPPASSRSTVGYHQDGVYISDQFLPREDNCLTVWMPLDDVAPDNGTLEYARGSHKWAPMAAGLGDQTFHGEGHYRDAVVACGAQQGIAADEIEFVPIKAKAGSAVIHHQNTWHGSSPNTSQARDRHALVSHIMRADVEFRGAPHPDYIYGRYKMHGSQEVSESFFPTIWPREERSESIKHLEEAEELHELERFV